MQHYILLQANRSCVRHSERRAYEQHTNAPHTMRVACRGHFLGRAYKRVGSRNDTPHNLVIKDLQYLCGAVENSPRPSCTELGAHGLYADVGSG